MKNSNNSHKTKNKKPNLKKVQFKQRFRNLNYYSMPESILFAFRKRVHFFYYFLFMLSCIVFTIL